MPPCYFVQHVQDEGDQIADDIPAEVNMTLHHIRGAIKKFCISVWCTNGTDKTIT